MSVFSQSKTKIQRIWMSTTENGTMLREGELEQYYSHHCIEVLTILLFFHSVKRRKIEDTIDKGEN